MSHPGPRAVEIMLSNEECAELRGWTRVEVLPRRAQLAKVVLACGEGPALSSLYSLFGSVRVVLCRYVTEVAEPKRDGDSNLGISAGGDTPQNACAHVG